MSRTTSRRFEPPCPRCGKETFTFQKEIPEGRTIRLVTRYWCGNSECDLDENGRFAGGYWYTLDDMEKFNDGRYGTYR